MSFRLKLQSVFAAFLIFSGSVCPPLTPGVLRLYSMRFCPYAQRTRLVLLHKKIEQVFDKLKPHCDKHKVAGYNLRGSGGIVPVS